MFSVVMPRIWVSPRSNRADPWTLGTTWTSALSWRMSLVPRPSMRTPSLITRSRMSFLVSERKAAEISFSRPSKSGPSFSSARALTRSSSVSRSFLPAIVSADASSLRTAPATASYTSSW